MRGVSEVLSAAADLLEKPGAWTQHEFCSGNGKRRCLASAISAVARRDCSPCLRAMGFHTLGEATRWNDAKGRTQAEIVERMRAAIARASGGGA